MTRRCLLAVVLLARAAGAETDAPAKAPEVALFGRPVTSVVLEAPTFVDEAEVRAALALHEGAVLERRALRRGVKRLVHLGRLADVQVWATPTAEGVEVRVRLVPAQVVAEVRFVGVAQVEEDALRRALGFNLGDRLDAVDLEAAAAGMRKLYLARGFAHARIEVRPEVTDVSQIAVLHVTVIEGPPTRIAALQVEADSPEVRRDVRVWSEIRIGDVFDERRVEEGMGELRLRDRARGFYEAQGQPPRVSPRGPDRVAVTLRYRRGPRYRISFQGVESLSVAELRELVVLSPEEELDDDALALLAGRVTTAYRRAAFPHVKVHAGVGPGRAPGERRLHIQVEEGPRSVLEEIQVEGAQGIAPRTIVEELTGEVQERFADDAGLRAVDPGDVRALLSEPPGRPRVARGVDVPMGPLALTLPERVYDEATYRDSVAVVRDLYSAQGYLSAEVRGPKPRWLDDGRAVWAILQVHEGVQTLIEDIELQGNQRLAGDMLAQVLDVEIGGPLDLSRVEKSRLALLKIYADQGYPFARVFQHVSYAADRSDARVRFVVEEGPHVTVERVLIKGNTSTLEPVVRDRLLLREGDAYSLRRVEESRQRLLGLGLFTSVDLSLVDPELAEPRKDLLVTLVERKAQVVEWKGGASFEDGPRTSVLYEHRNLLGLGLTSRSRLKLNYPPSFYWTIADPAVREELEGRFERAEFAAVDPLLRPLLFFEVQALLSLEYPKIFGLPMDPSGRSSIVALRENRSAFTLNRGAWQLGMDVRPLGWLALASTVELEGTDFNCWSQDFNGRYRTCGRDERGLTRRQDTGRLGQVTFREEAAIDRRDNPFRPHAGFHVAGNVDLALGGGVLYGENAYSRSRVETGVTSNFVKAAGSAAGYLPLTSALTLALLGRAGNIFGLSEQEHVPLYKKFFLGGTSSVRGFDEDRVLPNEVVAQQQRQLLAGSRSRDEVLDILNGASSGGRFFWNLRSELRFPVSREVDLGLFLDAGELYESAAKIDLSQFSAGAGTGVRWNTPVGPIAVDVGVALKDPALSIRESLREPAQIRWEERVRLHVSIGYF